MDNPYYFRLHHCRPRFKNNVENVLGYVAYGIAEIGEADTEEFNNLLNAHIKSFGGNICLKEKTINNWRTEISSLFSLFYELDGRSYPTISAIDLANETNLQLFFKRFITTFQYPGGYLKPDQILELVNAHILFHPGRWLSSYFINGRDICYITAQELCHCVFNDLRVTRDHEPVTITYDRIIKNRSQNVTYDSQSDIIRYAKDFLDYMVLAGLLVEESGKYYVNSKSVDFMYELSRTKHIFDKYQNSKECYTVSSLRHEWVIYASDAGEKIVSGLIKVKKTADVLIDTVKSKTNSLATDNKKNEIPVDTKKIGDLGEYIILNHEVLRVKSEGRPDLTHLIKQIPTHLAVGYDIKSMEVNEDPRFIEVKTTVSTSPLAFNMIHLTTNEWRVAETSGSTYCVYRLEITSDSKRLFMLRDPVGQYKRDRLKMIPRDGADIIFSNDCGEFLELLECRS